MDETEDINAAFDSILLSENRVVELGFEEGYSAGAREGRQEGERLGTQKGHQIGQEIGFYLGFGEQWGDLYINKEADKKTTKVLTAANRLVDLAKTFPAENTKEEDFTERLDLVRAKFKVLCSLLKVNSELGVTRDSW